MQRKTEIQTCKFILTRELKQGKLSSGSTVVVKRLAIASAVEDSLFLHAVNSLMSIKHRNIVRFLGYCSNVQEKVTREGDTSIIVMVRKRLLCFEYLRKGNLQKHLTGKCSDDMIHLILLPFALPLIK
jgi:hypothetical protein